MEPQVPDPGHGPDPEQADSPRLSSHGAQDQGAARDDVRAKPGALSLPVVQVDPAALRAVTTSMQVAMRSALRGISVMPPAGWSRALGENWPVLPTSFHAQVTAALAPGLQAVTSALAAMPPVIDPAVFRAFGEAMPKIDLSGLTQALDRLRDALPPNWESLSQYRELAEIARQDGIPVVWVPPGEVLSELLVAPDRNARLQVLSARRPEVLRSCRQVLAEVKDADLAVRVPQALEAITALEGGLPSAAQALSVAVTEAVLTAHVAGGRRYQKLADDVDVDIEELSVSELRGAITLLPITRFYTSWWATSGAPLPSELSRHVTVHLAPASHLTADNALVAVMLLSSLLRDVDASAGAGGAT